MINFTEKLGISESELQIIKRVTGISIMCAILIVAGSYGFQRYTIQQQKLSKIRNSRSIPQDLTKNEFIPLDKEAHLALADRFLEMGRPQDALPHLHRIIAFQKNDRSMRSKLADAYLGAGYYDKALAEYESLLNEGAEDSLISLTRTRKGISLFYMGKISESREILLTCLDQNKSNAEASCFLGQIEATKADGLEKGIEFLNQSIQFDSTYVEAWYQLGRLYMSMSKYNEARIYLLTALEKDPLHAKSHSRLGMVYYYLAMPEQAKKSYLTALALNPRDYNTRYNLGELYFSILNEPVKAIEQFKFALQENPGHVDANFKTGIICLTNGMNKEAVTYFDNALNNDGLNTRIMLQKAVALEKLGSKDDALEIYRTIVSIDPLHSPAIQKIKLLTKG